MNNYINKYTLIFILLTLFYPIVEAIDYSFYQTPGDTINQTDQAGLKQGPWIIHKNNSNNITEKGLYKNNKKNGVWITYYSNGNIKSKITYSYNQPIGECSFYYKNGKLREHGNWKGDHWTGAYKFYYENGQLSYDWNYDSSGKRTGEQIYYHSNGTKMYEGNWNKGKTEGNLKVYNEKGILVEEKIYAEGKLTKSVVKQTETESSYGEYEIPRLKFNGTGEHTVLNDDGTIDVKGYFVNGYLYNGDKFNYDKNGNLLYITSFKNGEKAGIKSHSPTTKKE